MALQGNFRKALRKSIKHIQTHRTEVEENEMEVETTLQKHNGSVLGGDISDGTAAESKKRVKDCSETRFKDVEDSLVL